MAEFGLLGSDDLYASAQASVNFVVQRCLQPYRGHLRAVSSFVDPEGQVMHWHDFGDLEGPGWAANTAGGAHELFRWAKLLRSDSFQAQALGLLDHILEDGFLEETSGFIWPYWDTVAERFCLNYRHGDDWLCPGSLALVGVQLLAFADDLRGDERYPVMQWAAARLGEWLFAHTPHLENGWLPRRITPQGEPFRTDPNGLPDIIFDHSADGLFLVQLAVALTARGLANYRQEIASLCDAFVAVGGFWGSINHDTYDDHECVAYAVAFQVLRQAAELLSRPDWRSFAYDKALAGLERFRMTEDRHGVPTAGLLWMEETWDTAYLWENAHAALAYLEAWQETSRETYRDHGLAILSAIAAHHHGPYGFLTEGVDWNNHVSSVHHIRGELYGDIRYTEPLLNNLHFLMPTHSYFEQIGYVPPQGWAAEDTLRRVRELAEAAWDRAKRAQWVT